MAGALDNENAGLTTTSCGLSDLRRKLTTTREASSYTGLY
jgi:hypothetical protein